MKPFIIIAFVSLFMSATLFAADLPKSNCSSICLDNISVYLDNGTLVLKSHSKGDYTIKITDKSELYVNGRFVETNTYEKRLLSEFRDGMIDLTESAKEIGYKGAKIGVKAVAGLVEVFCTDLELEEYEVELEEEAERLETQAEELEDLAEELEELHLELKSRIPELEELKAF